MKAVLIVELKGFAAQATSLAERMDAISLTDASIRTAIRSVVNEAVAQIQAVIQSKSVIEIGGDTWVINLKTLTKRSIGARIFTKSWRAESFRVVCFI